eukprot:366232-Chlamydomonas_euryale.AAC.24
MSAPSLPPFSLPRTTTPRHHVDLTAVCAVCKDGCSPSHPSSYPAPPRRAVTPTSPPRARSL